MSTENTSFKKRQEDAAKKQSGQMAPDVDQDGKMINPHNPDFITRVPWYLGSSGPTLKHHTKQKNDQVLTLTDTDRLIEEKIKNQQNLAETSNRIIYRKGACKNCGAMTHKEKDCIERPRSSKRSAWKTGLDIAPDETILNFQEHGKVNYSAKRDNWQGYDPTEYNTVVDRFNKMEEERKKVKGLEKEKRMMEEEEARKMKKLDKIERKRLKLELQQNTLDNSSSSVTATATDGNNNIPQPVKSKTKKIKKYEGKKRGKKLNKNDDEDSDTASDNSDEDSDSESDTSDSDSDYESDEDDEDGGDDTKEFLERDENARDFQARQSRQGGVNGAEMKVTARNLRIREDTPKYLRNLDLDSAHYDPKSRSMRANPFPHENPEELPFAGDNFVRYTGDALKLAATQVLCWDMKTGDNHGSSSSGSSGEMNMIDVLSNPSQAELYHKQATETRKIQEVSKKKELYAKYGVSEEEQHKTLDMRLRLGQTEAYNEYSWDGRIVKGAGKVIPKSKYEEDVLTNNHTAVWGSYYNTLRSCWGYACCHAILLNAYCTGEAGRLANDKANNHSMDANQTRQMLENRKDLTTKAKLNATNNSITKRSELYGESSGGVNIHEEMNEEKLKQAILREEEFHQQSLLSGSSGNHSSSSSSNNNNNPRKSNSRDEEKINKSGTAGAYNSMKVVDVQLEDMEAYRLKKQRRDDPMMMMMMNNDELLEK